MRRHIFTISILASFYFSSGRVGAINFNPRQDDEPDHLLSGRRSTESSGCYPVLGVKGQGGSGTHPRLEIRELERKPDQFNVYLLGLQRFQQMDQNERLSYFRVAGESSW